MARVVRGCELIVKFMSEKIYLIWNQFSSHSSCSCGRSRSTSLITFCRVWSLSCDFCVCAVSAAAVRSTIFTPPPPPCQLQRVLGLVGWCALDRQADRQVEGDLVSFRQQVALWSQNQFHTFVSSSAKDKTGVNGTHEQNDLRELFHIGSRNFETDPNCFLFNAF